MIVIYRSPKVPSGIMASNSKPDNIPWLFKKPLTEKELQELADRILFEDLPLDNLEVTDIEEEDDDLDEITSDHQITANTSQPIFYTDETEIVQLENTAAESGITAPADNIDGTNSDTNIERKCHNAANSQYGNDTETNENIAASTSEIQSMRKKKSDQQDERLNKKMKTKMTRRSTTLNEASNLPVTVPINVPARKWRKQIQEEEIGCYSMPIACLEKLLEYEPRSECASCGTVHDPK
ncbi:hypothetical protein JTB14_000401 [Gonioctena quinquepunctata]|nr:hypothetical protein JTB14_000401 [Gonioctena quinquepunctata]